MSRFLLAALAVFVGGCRLEPTEPPNATSQDTLAAQADGAQTPVRPRAAEPIPDPPVAAGDTMRVTTDRAGAPTPPIPDTPSVAASGWVVPVLGVQPRDLVNTFEDARSEGRTHNAIDILAPRGTPVIAATPGTVKRLFTSDKGGLTVYVLGDDERTVSYYAHLDAYAPGLAQDQRLARGDAIGTVGDSGNAAPGNTHLHFAVWTVAPGASFWDGEPVNPYGLLRGASR